MCCHLGNYVFSCDFYSFVWLKNLEFKPKKNEKSKHPGQKPKCPAWEHKTVAQIDINNSYRLFSLLYELWAENFRMKYP